MEIDIGRQLADLGLSAGLGMLSALLYDLLRSVRLRRRHNRPLTHALDIFYALCVGLILLRLALGAGEGALRLYMLLGFGAGALLYMGLLASFLQPLWNFWLSTAGTAWRLLRRGAAFVLSPLKKIAAFLKKFFSFPKKYATIKKKWALVLLRRKGKTHGSQEKTQQPRIADRAGRSGHRGSSGDRTGIQ